MPRGGKRPGAGRKKKDRSDQETFEDAEAYLEAVVQGRTPPDAVRVGAAKALIAYQKAKQRLPIKSPSPAAIRKKIDADIQRVLAEEFEKKAKKIRQKYQE